MTGFADFIVSHRGVQFGQLLLDYQLYRFGQGLLESGRRSSISDVLSLPLSFQIRINPEIAVEDVLLLVLDHLCLLDYRLDGLVKLSHYLALIRDGVFLELLQSGLQLVPGKLKLAHRPLFDNFWRPLLGSVRKTRVVFGLVENQLACRGIDARPGLCLHKLRLHHCL